MIPYKTKPIGFCVLLFLTHIYIQADESQLTIAFVIDQFAYRHLEKLRPYLKGGLRFLLDEGIVYTQAYVPYGCPTTGPGHTTLNTGTLPRVHGIIDNDWYCDGKVVHCDDSDAETDVVFGPHGLQPYGKSPHYIMVDGLSDQLMLQTLQHKNYKVFSISLKSHPAICTANKMGKAIWFDPKTGIMTSSKAYFTELPVWLQTFNQKNHPAKKPYTWNLCHGCLPAAYQFKHTHNYKGAHYNHSLIGKTLAPHQNDEEPFKDFMITPAGTQLVFDATLACLDEYFSKDHPDEKLFLWVLPSGLDKLGHLMGPDNIEVIDFIYHLDYQMKKFMDCVNAKTRKRNILWALTADHGVAPLPEQIKEDGYTTACRVFGPDIAQKLNQLIKTTFDIDNLVMFFNGIIINKELLSSVDTQKCEQIKAMIIAFLESQPGIKKVWSCEELEKLCFEPGSIEAMYQKQLFKGRNVDFILHPTPYSIITNYEYGASHNNPYNYNTHIPIIIYQRATYQRKIIHDRVYNLQFAPTLAHILNISRPSACMADILPGIIFKEDCCF